VSNAGDVSPGVGSLPKPIPEGCQKGAEAVTGFVNLAPAERIEGLLDGTYSRTPVQAGDRLR
jgi:hypothetical protein